MKGLKPLFFIAMLILVAAWPLMFGNFYLSGDVLTVFAPLEKFFHEEQIIGRIPSWNPDVAWGFPVLASAQIGFFYPPLLLLRFLPWPWYLSIAWLAHLFFTTLGTYLFLKKLGRSNQASLFGAIAFSLSGWVIQHTTHLNIFFAAAWLPWQLYFAHQKKWAWLTLAIGLPFLIGQLQIPALMAVISSAYAIYSAKLQNVSFKKITLSLLLVVIGVIGISAAQVLPTLELMQLSSRGTEGSFDIAQANQFSWPIYHAPTIIFPKFFGSDNSYWGKRLEIENGFFIGTLPLLFALLAYWRTKKLKFFKWLVVISFLLALGNLSPFRLLGLEPSLWLFTSPARWLFFTTFGLAVLASHGFDSVIKNAKKYKYYLAISAATILLVVVAGNIALYSSPSAEQLYSFLANNFPDVISGRDSSYYLAKLDSLFLSLKTSSVSFSSPYTYLPLISLGAALLALKHKQASQILLAIAAAELIIITATTSPTASWKSITDTPTTVSSLPANVLAGEARLLTLRSGGDSGALLSNPSDRADDNYRQREQLIMSPLIHSLYDIPGVEWPAALDLQMHRDALAQLRPDDLTVMDVRAAEQNIGAVIKAEGDEISIQKLDAKPRAELFTDSGSVAAQYKEISPTDIQIETSAAESGTLLIRDTFYPGWRATINNEPEKITQDNIFRSLKVPAGENIVNLKYVPTKIYHGLAISSLTILISLLAAWRYGRR